MAYAMHAIPLPKAPTTHLTRQYQYSQTDLLGSENCDTAIALMAAHAMMHADGDVWSKFDSSEDVLQTMSSGIVWHSRWLAADPYRTPGEDFAQGAQVASPDEICELEGCPVSVTEECFAGTLESTDFGTPLEMALQDITKKWRGKGTRTYILTIKDQSTCLSIVNSEYFVFDSHPSDKFGMPSENGKAVLVACLTRKILLSYLWKKYEAHEYPDTLYTLAHVIATDLPAENRNRSSYEDMYGKLSKYVPRRESLVQAANTLSTYSLQDYASTAQGYAQTAAAQLSAATVAAQKGMAELKVDDVMGKMDDLFDQVEAKLDSLIETKTGSGSGAGAAKGKPGVKKGKGSPAKGDAADAKGAENEEEKGGEEGEGEAEDEEEEETGEENGEAKSEGEEHEVDFLQGKKPAHEKPVLEKDGKTVVPF